MRSLIFDFDGTIADSFETLLGIFEEISNRPSKLTPEEVKKLRGQSLKQIIKYLDIKRWQIPRLVLKAKRILAVKIIDIQVFPGMPETIRQLRGDGHRLYILSTNSSVNIDKLLKKHGLSDCFEKTYGDIGLRSKSSALNKIIRREKLNRRDCVYVGDEVRDIEAAKKAGVIPIAVGWGFNSPAALKRAGPARLAMSPSDLTEMLD